MHKETWVLEFEGIEAQAIMGCLPEERTTRQLVTTDVKLWLDGDLIPESDEVDPILDNRDVHRIVHESLEGNFRFQESALRAMAYRLRELPAVQKVWVRTCKPVAFPDANSCFQLTLE